MKNAHRSIAIVTCHIACAIKDRMDDDDFLRAIATVEAFSEKNVLDQRAQNMFSLLLYCSHKILQRVNCEQFFPEVEEKMLNLVMPSYLKVKDGDGNAGEVLQNQGKSNVENFLHDNLPKATLRGTVDEVLKFLDQDFCPSSCCCGSCVAFNVQSAICFVEATLGTSYTTGITAGAVRHFIKSKGVGCVGSVVRFRGSNKQVHAAHIQHGWFNSEDIAAMHEKLGLRKKKNARKETTSQTQTQEPTSEAVLEEPESEENLLTGQTQVQPDQDNEVHMIEQEQVQPDQDKEVHMIEQEQVQPDQDKEVHMIEQEQVQPDQDKEVHTIEQTQVQPDQDKEVHTIEQTQGSVLEEEGLVMTMTKRKRQKGGLVSTLYDKLHPGDVSGKRRRIQRKPPK